VHRDSLDPLLVRQWAGTLQGPVIFPADEAFDSARLVWNRAIDRQPLAIARCAHVEDVVRTIDFARAQEVSVAIRSGGHGQAGHGTCDGGIVLDLGSFRSVGVKPAARIAHVSGGARVSDVLDAMQPYGLLTPMGGCPDVGVGGLTLGGGESFLMAKFGAVCDNLRSAQVVTADAQVITVDDDEHPDLFWALRGGSGNFGVVTSFEYQLHALAEVLSGQLIFSVSRAREAMLRYRELLDDVPDELGTSGGLSPMPIGPMFFLAVSYCGDREAGERLLDRWIAVLRPDSETVKWGPYASELSVAPAPSVGTGRFLPELSDDVMNVYVASLATAPEQASAIWNELRGAVTRVPLDATAFPLRRRGFDLFLSVPWTTARERDAAIDWSSQLSGALAPFSGGVYVNNLNETESHRVREAYGPHYDRLAAIKKHYDPANFFRVNHNIHPGS
jgi:FAD/FMN-containing dehydrogenase